MTKWSITDFKILPDFKVAASFADGTQGTIDLAPRLSQGPLGDGFDTLCDAQIFAKAYLEYGALTWPGGINLAPDAMYERICKSGTAIVTAKNRMVA